MTKNQAIARIIVKAVLDDLHDRQGIRQELDDCGKEVLREICQTLRNKVAAILEEQLSPTADLNALRALGARGVVGVAPRDDEADANVLAAVRWAAEHPEEVDE